MTLQVKAFVLGPIENNVYLVFDDQTRAALLIDPAYAPGPLLKFVQENKLAVEKILITHAHFDHYYGLPDVKKALPSLPEVYLHPDDLALWQAGGSADIFTGTTIQVDEPDHLLAPNESIRLDGHEFTYRLAPGHSTGSVIYYSAELKSAFCGDVIFYHSIGRTDLPGGDTEQLLHSIRTQVFTLPDETILYPGHGPATTVAEEKANNPFL